MGRLDGKIAFVTGAARGQGRSHAVRLASEGADIIGLDVCTQVETVPYPMPTSGDLAATAAEIEALDRRIVTYEADVRDFDALQHAVDEGVSMMGGLDIVAANAGIGPQLAPAHELSESQWQTMIDTNLTGVWHTCKAAIPHLIERGGGAIINTGSAAAIVAYENIGNYVAAKHGVIGLTKTLALELAKHMIRVNSVHPTQVNTPMIMNENSFRFFCQGIENPTSEHFKAASQSLNAMPVPWVEPLDISNAVLFLASDEARYITGVALPVDLGVTIR
jgi:(+)-trans-carveol dehydrogenase